MLAARTMFLRRVINRQSCSHFTTDGLPNPVPSISLYGLKRTDPSSAHHIQTYSSISKASSGGKCSGECPVVRCDIQRLLSIDNRYDLYQFLRFLIVSGRFYDEVKCLVVEHERHLTFPQVLTLVNMYSWNHKKEGVNAMQGYAEECYPVEFAAQDKFVPHKTLCDNPNEPIRVLSKLLDMASSRSHMKAVVLTQAELFLNRLIWRGSRSVVDRVNKYIVNDCSPELRGPLLCSSWVSFYLSPYDSDQSRAADILRANEQVMLPHLGLTLSSVAEHLLDERQLNRYYVLLQVFSKRSHRTKTKDLVEKLFYHFYKTNNLRGCLACESLASELNLDLPHDVQYKCDTIKKSKSVHLSSMDMKFIF